MYRTVLAAEVRYSYVLQWDLSEEGGALTARIPRHDSSAAKPHPEPGQAAVTVKRIGQKIPDGQKRCRVGDKEANKEMTETTYLCVCVCVTNSVDRLGRVSKAPGRMVLSWLS